MIKNFNYYVPENLIFGAGTFRQLATLPMPGKKALIVTMEDRLYVDETMELLRQNGVDYAVFDGVRANPSTHNVNDGARFGLENGCDFVLAVGGGSPIDAGQCIALMMYEGVENNDIWDYVQYYEGHKVANGCVPIVVVSTTAGPGSEAVPAGVISNDELEIKLDVASPYMYPKYSIVDPELHLTIPRYYTACQGMDIVFHCVEGYLNKYGNPISDMAYMTGLHYAAGSLVRAYNAPHDLDARSELALASNLAGIGQALADVISLHAMGHALGSFHHDLPHGTSLCIVAPEVLGYYAEVYPDETKKRMAQMSRLVGYGERTDGCVEFIVDLLKAIDLYYIDYTQFGIDESRCKEYAVQTVKNIAPYMDKDTHTLTESEVEMLFRKALARNRKNIAVWRGA